MERQVDHLAADLGCPAAILVVQKTNPPRAPIVLASIALRPVGLLARLNDLRAVTVRTLDGNVDHPCPPRTLIMRGHCTGKLLIWNITRNSHDNLTLPSVVLPKGWSRYSNDKVDIAGTLARVLRTLTKALPLDEPLSALSIGSSNEPQFRILESAFRGGLYLLDIEDTALAVVEERIQRQNAHQVRVIHGDYHEALRDAESVLCFRREHLDGRRMTLITLHHSLYYSPRSFWSDLLANLYEHLLVTEPAPGPSGAIHVVLMASRSEDPASTT
jgi:hypothetical protein